MAVAIQQRGVSDHYQSSPSTVVTTTWMSIQNIFPKHRLNLIMTYHEVESTNKSTNWSQSQRLHIFGLWVPKFLPDIILPVCLVWNVKQEPFMSKGFVVNKIPCVNKAPQKESQATIYGFVIITYDGENNACIYYIILTWYLICMLVILLNLTKQFVYVLDSMYGSLPSNNKYVAHCILPWFLTPSVTSTIEQVLLVSSTTNNQ